jgi:hypothetical protein
MGISSRTPLPEPVQAKSQGNLGVTRHRSRHATGIRSCPREATNPPQHLRHSRTTTMGILLRCPPCSRTFLVHRHGRTQVHHKVTILATISRTIRHPAGVQVGVVSMERRHLFMLHRRGTMTCQEGGTAPRIGCAAQSAPWSSTVMQNYNLTFKTCTTPTGRIRASTPAATRYLDTAVRGADMRKRIALQPRCDETHEVFSQPLL